MFTADQVVLFQGDSITDAHRRRGRNAANDPAALGHGYVFHTAAELLRRRPTLNLRIYDRGVSGDKVFQLADRWERDCLALKPDVLSILVGVNDYCHVFFHGFGGTLPDYQRDYRLLLERTRAELPDVKLVLGEPFLLQAGAISNALVEGLRDYQQAARALADDFDAVWVPYQQAFNNALRDAPADYWAPDGIHPSLPGHLLMAQAWLRAVEG